MKIDRLIGALEDAEDADVRRIGASIKRRYGGQDLPDPAAERQRLLEQARNRFPNPFVREFEAWCTKAAAFHDALPRGDEDATRDALVLFRTSALVILQQVCSFMPFIFIGSLLRPRLSALPEPRRAGRMLRLIIQYYTDFYHARDKRQAEAAQVNLLTNLINFYAQFWDTEPFASVFVLHDLAREAGGFRTLLPKRFSDLLAMLRELRNTDVHRFIASRDIEIVELVHRVIECATLEVVDILARIFERFRIVYVIPKSLAGITAAPAALDLCALDLPVLAYASDPAVSADADRFEEGQLYLVRRGKEAEAGETLTPSDYLNLTPFMLYESRQAREGGPLSTGLAGRDMFLFWHYEVQKRVAQYLAYGAQHSFDVSEIRTRTARAMPHVVDEIRRLRDQFDQILALVQETGALTAEEAGARIAPADFAARCWSASRQHLAALLDVDSYDDDGVHRAEVLPGAARAFDETVFVPPAEAEALTRFLAGRMRGLVVVGPSGIGKSSLLCHQVLELRRAGRPALFLSGRTLTDASFKTILAEHASRAVLRSKEPSALGNYLLDRDITLPVFIDSVNEYVGPGGALSLLRSILAGIADADDLPNLQVVLSCRPELWDRHTGHPFGTAAAEAAGSAEDTLDPRHFWAGQPLRIRPFASANSRARLYAAYQARYALLPRSYAALPRSVQRLIATPLLLLIVAQTYANLPGDQSAEEHAIPRELDFFRVFQALTRRKLDAAGAEFASPQPELCQEALSAFTRLLLSRITSLPPGTDAVALAAQDVLPPQPPRREHADMLPWTLLGEAESFASHWAADASGQSRFDALRDVGLIEVIWVEEEGFFDTQKGRYCRFFHEQYTEFQFGAAYMAGLLGSLGDADPARAAAVAQAVAWLLEGAVRTPVLAGALDHWLVANLRRGGRDAAVFALLGRLAGSDSGGARFYAGSFLNLLLQRGIMPPDRLFARVFADGTPALRLVAAEFLAEDLAPVPPETMREFIAAAQGEADKPALIRLAERMVLHFGQAPEDVAAYLARALHALANALDLGVALARKGAVSAELTFLTAFVEGALLSLATSQQHMLCLRGFLAAHYAIPIKVLVERSTGLGVLASIPESFLRKFFYRKIEEQGVQVWEGEVAPVGGNADFFTDDGPSGKRQMIVELLPYLAAMHNGELDAAMLARGSAFRAVVLRMLNVGVNSIVGFLAMVMVAVLVHDDWPLIEDLVAELIEHGTEGGRFYASLLVVNVVYADPTEAARAIRVFNDTIIPAVLRRGVERDFPLLGCVVVCDIDFAAAWPGTTAAIDTLIDTTQRDGQEDEIAAFGAELLKAAFVPDPRVAGATLELLLDRQLLDQPAWRGAVEDVMAALLATHPTVLAAIIAARHIPDHVVREARRRVGSELAPAREQFRNQIGWNRVIVAAARSHPPLRALLLRDLVGGIARSATLEQLAGEFRRFCTGLVDLFLGGAEPHSTRLTMADILE